MTLLRCGKKHLFRHESGNGSRMASSPAYSADWNDRVSGGLEWPPDWNGCQIEMEEVKWQKYMKQKN